MNHPTFHAPALETMSGFLPAFEFTALLAADDLNAIYLAKQRSLDREVAIKVLAPHVSESPEFRSSFETTARTMARLKHPNLIGVFDSGYTDGMLFYVMEFVPGRSLEHSMRGQPVEFTQALGLIEGICEGLAHAHAHGIVHGKLEPSHILLNQKAEPKISNFGFTQAADDETEECPHYTAPEILTRQSVADARTDIFAVGAILYELITGQKHGPQAQPPSALTSVKPEIDAIWRKATEADPALRFPDVRSLREALADLLNPRRAETLGRPPDSQRLGVRKPIQGAVPPTRITLPKQRSGINKGAILNLCLLVVLGFAAWFYWKRTQQRNTQVIPQPAPDVTVIREREKAENQLKETELQKNTQPPDQPPTPPVETPEASLERLRGNLSAGSRVEMPKGSLHQGDSHYFLVKDPMTWPEAAAFAEQHGAHLAIPNVTADLLWLSRNLSGDTGFWIGAAKNGGTQWALADGSAWKPNKEPAGSGVYLAVDKNGYLQAEAHRVRRPSVIQWHADGSNPGKLESLLVATKTSLSGTPPAFPPGTQSFGNRRYLLVAQALPWRAAVDLAEKSGGHLAVAADAAEAATLAEMTSGVDSKHGFWLGGFLKSGQWVWITDEPWKTASWARDADSESSDTGLTLRPDKGWDARSLAEPASGFIIEWSKDRDAKSSTTPAAPGVDIATLTSRAHGLIAAAERKRTEKLTANVTKFNWALDGYQRGISKNEQAFWNSHIANLKLAVANQRVPEAVPVSSGIRLSAKMAKISEDAAKAQAQIDADLLAEAERIRSAYVAKLGEARKAAENSGQRTLAETIRKELAAAANINIWLSSLNVDPSPSGPDLEEKEERQRRPERDRNDDGEGRGRGPIAE
jgi:serine/threonine protein kinase